MTMAHQFALSIVKEIIAHKKQKGMKPDYALQSEVTRQVVTALNDLVREGTISRCMAGVNRVPAYSLTAK